MESFDTKVKNKWKFIDKPLVLISLGLLTRVEGNTKTDILSVLFSL